MNFVDHVSLTLMSGKGGAGMVHFKSEKYRPHGGPDGGDGGRGGSIVIKVDPNTQTLAHLAPLHHLKAKAGGNGQKDLKSGKSGADIEILVPLGTTLSVNNKIEHDFTQISSMVYLKGGRGGKGNWHFRSATNQAPHRAETGELGLKREVTLQLKLIADVGLVGLPNVGKSSLLNALTRANSQVGSYPFTTLQPHLGVLIRDNWECIIADIPGIIAGAAIGKGLGHDFLAHIERTSLLLICLSGDAADIVDEYRVVKHELEQYSINLLKKPQILLVTKADLLTKDKIKQLSRQIKSEFQQDIMFVSSITNVGLVELINRLQLKLTTVA